VLPVGGLLAETATTLTQDEYEAVEKLASHDRMQLEDLLLSVDRFVADVPTCTVPPLVRRHLLDRRGLFGVRVSLPMIRQGRAATAADLATSLENRSGVVALQDELRERFANRRDVLRARSALLAVDRVMADVPAGVASEINTEIERIQAGAHAFAEIRLLNDCRRGLVDFAGVEGDEIERLLGSAGTSPAARLGLEPDTPVDEVRNGLLAEIDRWRRKGAHPLVTKEVADAATVLVRTCEGALAGLG
jgi:hypothetical protein